MPNLYSTLAAWAAFALVLGKDKPVIFRTQKAFTHTVHTHSDSLRGFETQVRCLAEVQGFLDVSSNSTRCEVIELYPSVHAPMSWPMLRASQWVREGPMVTIGSNLAFLFALWLNIWLWLRYTAMSILATRCHKVQTRSNKGWQRDCLLGTYRSMLTIATYSYFMQQECINNHTALMNSEVDTRTGATEIGTSCWNPPYLSISIHIYPYRSISIHIYPYLSISIHIYPYLSVSVISVMLAMPVMSVCCTCCMYCILLTSSHRHIWLRWFRSCLSFPPLRWALCAAVREGMGLSVCEALWHLFGIFFASFWHRSIWLNKS